MDVKGRVEIDRELCKGCGLCVEACVPKVLHLAARLNASGYTPAEYTGTNCSGCGLCFYACPEPGTLRVWKLMATVAA